MHCNFFDFYIERSSPGATIRSNRYKEAGCQTPTDLNLRLSPLLNSRLSTTHSVSRYNAEKESKPLENLEDETKPEEQSEEVTDDELSMIGDFMVKESLVEAAAEYDDPFQVEKNS